MPPDILQLILEMLQRLNEWLRVAPTQEPWHDRWVAPLLPALFGGVIGAAAVVWLTEGLERRMRRQAQTERAFEEVGSPLYENIRQSRASRMVPPGFDASVRASGRLASIRTQLGEADRLLRHPLRFYLPQGAMEAANAWVSAEHLLQSYWDIPFQTGTIPERIAFALFVTDSALKLDGVGEREVDRTVQIFEPQIPEEERKRIVGQVRDEPDSFEDQRRQAEGWHAQKMGTDAALSEAVRALNEMLSAGPDAQRSVSWGRRLARRPRL